MTVFHALLQILHSIWDCVQTSTGYLCLTLSGLWFSLLLVSPALRTDLFLFHPCRDRTGSAKSKRVGQKF